MAISPVKDVLAENGGLSCTLSRRLSPGFCHWDFPEVRASPVLRRSAPAGWTASCGPRRGLGPPIGVVCWRPQAGFPACFRPGRICSGSLSRGIRPVLGIPAVLGPLVLFLWMMVFLLGRGCEVYPSGSGPGPRGEEARGPFFGCPSARVPGFRECVSGTAEPPRDGPPYGVVSWPARGFLNRLPHRQPSRSPHQEFTRLRAVLAGPCGLLFGVWQGQEIRPL